MVNLMKRTFVPYYAGSLYAVIYGVLAQFSMRMEKFADLFAVMSFGFVFILPVVMGAMTVYFASESKRKSWLFAIFMPWVTMTLSLLISCLVGWEGTICLIMAAGVFLPLSSVGGVITKIVLNSIEISRKSQLAFGVLLLAPVLSPWIENHFAVPVDHVRAYTSIEIDSPADVVWQNIIRVKPINEPISGFFYKMGFPKPIEATLSHEGVGGVRQASFENNLLFVETVTEWQDKKLLSFAIDVDPNHTPPTTLDSHVTVGGRYFDVLQGTYELEALSDNRTRLNLWSDFRVSTRFNFYASLWAEYLMTDIQQSILTVIKKRCE